MHKFKPFVFDPLKEMDLAIPKANRRAALEDAAVFLKEQLLAYIAEQKSPITGGRWIKGLSSAYRAQKEAEGGSSIADLELTGEFLDGITVETDGRRLFVDVAEDMRGRAEGFYTGVYGKSSAVKPRQALPQKGDTFKSQITRDLKVLLSEYEDE